MTAPRLWLLGRPRFEHDDHPTDLPPAKGIGLLAYLAVTRDPVPREHLQALLWPESLADAARKNLRNILWAIRKALGDDVLDSPDDRLVLAPAAWVDLWEFERRVAAAQAPAAGSDAVRAALALYGGLFLDGLTFGDAPELDLWLAGERERLAQIYLREVGALVDHQRASGNWPAVLAAARQGLALDNLQEPLHRALMEAHARLGERPEALRQYDALRAVLDRELGVEPLAATETLRAAIQAGTLGPAPPAARPGPRSPRRAPDGGEAGRVPFVGRQAELAFLDDEWRQAAAGRVRVVLITGEIGIGKSRLWQEWAAALPADARVLETRCLESTRALPFAPVTALFGTAACIAGLVAPDSGVSPIWLAELARLLPEIRVARPDLPEPPPLPPDEERRRLFEAITQCLVALGPGPIALFVDDVHWADRATLDWLDYLVHRLEARPLLLVAAYRLEDAPPALVQLAARWAREGLAGRLAPPRLDAAESAALAAALQVDPAARDRIREQSAGNPYFLIELSHAPAGDLPPALGELIRARVDRLPDAARQVLQAAAVLEPGIAFAPLRRTSGRGEEEMLDALDELLDAGILVEQAGRYAFAHPLVAAVVREDLSAARRAFLNRRAAEAVEAAHPGAPDAVAGQLAAYYTAAGEPARAAGMAARAAARALDLGAPAEAIAFYRQALALDPGPARQMDLAHALFWSGDLDAARTAYQAAFDAFLASGDRPGAARACLGVAETLMPAGRVPEAVAWIERGLTYADPQADPATYALARFLTGPSRLAADRPLAEVQTALAAATRLARDHHLPGMLARGRFALGTMLAERGDLAGAVQAYRDSIVLAEQAGDTFQALLSYNNTAYHALLLGDLAQARAYVDTGLAQAEARGLRVPLQYLYSTRGEIALAEADWEGAEAWFRRGLAEAQAMGNLTQAANYQANLGLVAQGRGDLDTAARQLEIARAAAARVPAPYLQAQIAIWLAAVQQARGAAAAAADALAQAEQLAAGRGFSRLEAEIARLRGDSPAPIPAAQPALPPG